MKLWKKFPNEKKVITRRDNMKEIISFKSVKNKKSLEPKKSSKSFSKSFSSNSSELDLEHAEKTKKNLEELKRKAIQMNLKDKKKFNELKIISTTLSSDLIRNKKKNNNMKINSIKTIYPTIPNNKSRKKVSIFNLKLKKSNSPPNYNNNSLLNKWRENINKLFTKSLKKTKKEMIQILKRHKIRNIKKKFKIRNITTINKDQENTEQNNNKIEISSPFKNTYTYIPKNYINLEQNSQSSFSSKSLNKFDYNRNNNIYYYNNNNKGYGRNYQRKISYKNYMKEEYILNTKWKKKLGILNTDIKYSADLLSSLDFQYCTIRDEISLISDSVHYFKISLFGKEDLLSAFNNKDLYTQIYINKTLEETCASLSLIPKIILKEYYIYCDKFISLPDPRREFHFSRVINNEMECFNENIKTLYKVVNFIKASFEVYIQLFNPVDEEMLIAKNEFEVLKIIFEKSRYYIGNLINFANNMLKDYNFDKKLIKKGKPILDGIKERLREENWSIYDYYSAPKRKERKKETKSRNYISRKFKKGNMNPMKSNLNLQSNEYFQKIFRIKKALDNSEIDHLTDEIRLKKLGLNVGKPMALIFSPLMTKMLKYIKKDSREKIIALRSTEKFFPVQEKEEEKFI